MDETVDAQWWEDHGPEAQLAAAVRELRTTRGLSQREVADRMSGFGFKYHPATVSQVEGGQRGISFNEAAALATIFNINPADLLYVSQRIVTQGSVANMEKRLADADHRLQESHRRLHAARRRLTDAQGHLDLLRHQAEQAVTYVAEADLESAKAEHDLRQAEAMRDLIAVELAEARKRLREGAHRQSTRTESESK